MNDNRIRFDLIVHDLKSPLSVIETNVRLLAEKTEKFGPLTEKQKKLLARVLRNVRLAQRRVLDALEQGRSEGGANKFSIARVREILLNWIALIRDSIKRFGLSS